MAAEQGFPDELGAVLGNLIETAGSVPKADDVAAKLHQHIVGKTVLITGVAPLGLGTEAARVIAQHKPRALILASRSPNKIATVQKELQKLQTGLVVEALPLDLADVASIREAAATVLERHPTIDVLINNAAVMMLQTLQTVPLPAEAAAAAQEASKLPASIERHFFINHLGHFLFTNLLVPAFAAGARVVTVTSRAHVASPVVALDNPSLLGDSPATRAAYKPVLAYAQSKTANVLFTVGLAQRLAAKGVKAYNVDPGVVTGTDLGRSVPLQTRKELGWVQDNGEPSTLFLTHQQAVASYIVAAYDPDLEDKPAAYIDSAEVDTNIKSFATNPALADRLWTLSEQLVGQTFAY